MEINFFPSWLMERLGIGKAAQRDFGILVSSVIVLAFSPLLIHVPHLCLAQKLLHLPCPGCGILHSLAAIQRLRFVESWRSNPAGVILASMLCFQVAGRSISIAASQTSRAVDRLSRSWSIAVLVSLASVWICRILFGGTHNGLGFLP
ncbi:MAG: DUF2752 domain-containing protein [Terracidiphilus sp.]|jgi:hypothetical protein